MPDAQLPLRGRPKKPETIARDKVFEENKRLRQLIYVRGMTNPHDDDDLDKVSDIDELRDTALDVRE